MSYVKLFERIKNGEIIILDGGIGTELQKRGVAMAPGAWCGPGSLHNRPLLESIHLDYINVGADIITANTFASSRIMLAQDGFEGQFSEINKNAVDAALAARRKSGRKDILVAGSLSHMIPMQAGTDRVGTADLSDELIAESLEEMVLLLKNQGCDLILLEMMYHPGRAKLAVEAAGKSGLPVWAGFSLKRDETGSYCSFGYNDYSADAVFDSVDPALVDVMGLMHMDAMVIDAALELLKSRWAGPVSVYPDSGHFKMPEWKFEDVWQPSEIADFARSWVDRGVSILGGCCGLGPEHIKALAELKDTLFS